MSQYGDLDLSEHPLPRNSKNDRKLNMPKKKDMRGRERELERVRGVMRKRVGEGEILREISKETKRDRSKETKR